MLRESGKMSGQNYDLKGALDPNIESGVEHGVALVSFTRAITGKSTAELDAARNELLAVAGSAAVATAALIAANFSLLDRLANAIGISLDDMMVKPSADIRELLGINAYPSAANTAL
jgi:hypothetical protein